MDKWLEKAERPLCFALALALLAQIVWILLSFNFRYTDMDQTLMWYGTHEFSEGRFHTPRYFGQDYGTMIEALLAVPFTWMGYHIALPLVSVVLLLTPYFLMACRQGLSWKKIWPVVSFLALLPAEYFMMGAMPRDMVTGIAVTSAAFLFIGNEKTWARMLLGFFCVLGWSVNNGAALLGAVITIYTLFLGGFTWRKMAAVVSGYLVGLTLHLLVGFYFYSHPELVVHHAWDFHYAWKQVWDGWKNLDRHFAWITPLLRKQGWFMLPLLCGIIAWAAIKRNRPVAVAAIALTVLVMASFGILKIHDGRDSIFFSHERMFMALPVSICFLALLLPGSVRLSTVLSLAGFAVIGMNMWRLDQVIDYHWDPKRYRVVEVMTVHQVQEQCRELQRLVLENHAEAVIMGPESYQNATLSTACPCLTDIELIIWPTYERRGWVTKQMDRPVFRSVVWNGFDLHEGLNKELNGVTIEFLPAKWFEHVYLVKGQDFNPLAVYRSYGLGVSYY